MTAKQKNSPERFSSAVDRALLIRCLILGVIVIVYLVSYGVYYSRSDRKANYDFLYGAFLYRRASEDASKYDEAEKVFKDILSLCGIRHWQELSLFYLGNIYYERGDVTEAERAYGNYISRFPAGRWAQEAGIAMAYLAENRGLYELAIERYENVLEEFPEDYLLKEAYLGVGRSYEMLKKFSFAREYYGKLKANYPGSAWQRKAEERLEEIEAAVKLGGN